MCKSDTEKRLPVPYFSVNFPHIYHCVNEMIGNGLRTIESQVTGKHLKRFLKQHWTSIARRRNAWMGRKGPNRREHMFLGFIRRFYFRRNPPLKTSSIIVSPPPDYTSYLPNIFLIKVDCHARPFRRRRTVLNQYLPSMRWPDTWPKIALFLSTLSHHHPLMTYLFRSSVAV